MSLDEAKQILKDYAEHLTFKEEGDYIIVQSKHFLGNGMFPKIASIVRQNGGEYVSAGKDSHFRFSKNPSQGQSLCPHCGKPLTVTITKA
jgi:hypothetical protein